MLFALPNCIRSTLLLIYDTLGVHMAYFNNGNCFASIKSPKPLNQFVGKRHSMLDYIYIYVKSIV